MVGVIVTNKSKLPEYSVWTGMKKRCYNPKAASYKDYGGRGILIDERWKESFETFLEDMGPRPSSEYSIERIDNNGPYSPENCKWILKSEQSKNRRPYLRYAATCAECSSDLGMRIPSRIKLSENQFCNHSCALKFTRRKQAEANPIEHGTRRGYERLKCRCEACSEANRVYLREYAAKRTERQPDWRARKYRKSA